MAKRAETEAKFNKFFGPILFGVILVFVFGAVGFSFIPCKTGYTGKIWNCKDINECEGWSHKCSDLATCINLGNVQSFNFC